MPTANDEVPGTVKRSPSKAVRTWKKTHDAAVEQYGEGERAHRTAFASLKQGFEKVGTAGRRSSGRVRRTRAPRSPPPRSAAGRGRPSAAWILSSGTRARSCSSARGGSDAAERPGSTRELARSDRSRAVAASVPRATVLGCPSDLIDGRVRQRTARSACGGGSRGGGGRRVHVGQKRTAVEVTTDDPVGGARRSRRRCACSTRTPPTWTSSSCWRGSTRRRSGASSGTTRTRSTSAGSRRRPPRSWCGRPRGSAR